jgi:hypothetical protein
VKTENGTKGRRPERLKSNLTYPLRASLLPSVALIALIVTALVAYKVKVCFKENPTEVITG